MKIIRNNIIPFKGFKAINLFGVLFVRKSATISDVDINHEAIHTEQMKECLYIGFYILYLLNWLMNLVHFGFSHKAYRYIDFEIEAYDHQDDLTYLQNRKHYRWLWTE